ncbi:hypothetical protein Tco_0737550 [Tanacetum coccineum]
MIDPKSANNHKDQIALDDALVAPANRLKIGKCNLRLSSDVTSKEATLQVVYDVLKLTPFYKAFQVSADVPEIYMQEFWASAYVHNRSVRFKMNNKKHILNLDQFRDILQICPKVGNKKFEEPPLEKEILAFLASLGHSGEIRKITDVNVNKLHQPWRSFAAIINKCLSGKPSYDSLRLSQAQILWGMYNNKKVDYAYLLWEDFIYQIENKNTKKGNAMYYPRFTKLVVNFVMAKDPSIPRRNKVNWHYARDDPMFTTINVISRNEDTQLYGTILPVALTNEDIRNSESYKEYYAIASGKIPPKTKGSKKKADTDATTKQKPPTVPKEKKGKKTGKGKQKAKELETISEAVLTEAEQLKIITKRSRKETHSSHASGSGADEGTGVTPGVPDAPDYDSDDDISWKSSEDDQDDDKIDDDENAQDDEDEDKNDDDENAQDDDDEAQTESEDDGDDFIHPKLTTHDDETTHEEETDEDDTFDPIVHTPSHVSSSDDEESDNDVEGVDAEGEKSDEDATYVEDQGNEADKDTNANLEGRDDVMTDVILPQVQATQEIEDTHVTLTPVNPDGQQQSSEAPLNRDFLLLTVAEPSFFVPTMSPTHRPIHLFPFPTFSQPPIPGHATTLNDDQEPSAGIDEGSKRRSGRKRTDYQCSKRVQHLSDERNMQSLTELEYFYEKSTKPQSEQLDWCIIRSTAEFIRMIAKAIPLGLSYQGRHDIEECYLFCTRKVVIFNVEERIAFNVSLRMFTRSVVIQRRVEDLQLGVESYQKKLNLTKPDTLMHIDELHKFSDGTLDDVRTALNDRLKGIRMEYCLRLFGQRGQVECSEEL